MVLPADATFQHPRVTKDAGSRRASRYGAAPMKVVWFAVAALSVGLALSGAACSDNYCPNGASSGGSGGTAGAGGSSCTSESVNGGSGGGTTTCAALTATKACLTTFCKSDGASTPFCNCYLKGFDLSAPNTDANGNETGCACITFDDAKLCAAFPDPDASDVDCSVVSGQVSSMCVGVD